MGSHPPHPGDAPPPVNGAAKSQAAAGAGAGATGLVGWWKQVTGQHGAAVRTHANTIATKVRARTQGLKWSMPVDVKVDFLRPTIETVRETLTNVWIQLPPPVQQAAPFVGVAMGSGLIVYVVQQRRIGYQKRRNTELTSQIRVLRNDREELLKRIQSLKSKSGMPRSDVEARLAKAIAEATNAAAAAADAAARAATACIIQRPQQVLKGNFPSHSNSFPSGLSGPPSPAE